MLRRHRQIRTQLLQMIDAVVFGVSFWLAWLIRYEAGLAFNWKAIGAFEVFIWFYLMLIIAGPLVLEAQGFYDRPDLGPRRTGLWALFKGCCLTALGLIIVLFFFPYVELPRTIAVLFGFISFVILAAKEELLRVGLSSKFARTQLQRHFILVGSPEETTRMRQDLEDSGEDDIVILGNFDLGVQPVSVLAQMLHEHSVNGVIVSARQSSFGKIEEAIRACEIEGVEVWLKADFFQTQISRPSFDDFHGHPVLVFRTAPDTSWQSVLKQVIDFLVALVAVILLAIPFILIGLAIKLSSPGPILFRQRRCGLNGRPFTIFKFRTMTSDAEQRKQELAAMNEMSGPVFKIKNDPRVTPIGRVLRKFSIDECPQFYNVLRGEMSLVGPRPLPVDEVKRFDDLAHRRRLSVKPGLTCLWQVSGRNKVSNFSDWVRLDLEYIDNWSLWLDLKILLRTVPIVVLGNGAQ